MDEKELNQLCKKFQQEIVNLFNKQDNLPFILKYYLFKQVWAIIEQQKIQNDNMAAQELKKEGEEQ